MRQMIIAAILASGFALMNVTAKAQTTNGVDTLKVTHQIEFEVQGMSCQAGCANGIDNMLKQQKGVVKSKTTYDTGTSTIWYNKELISQKEIENLIKDRGFKVKVKTEDQEEDL
ncbi:heavy metal-associated domain-containing protein [Imperialibacter roseus]|uniref:Heavy metal-associated domain-containing protein n=1 Tax=Imperialibacter roseus TaxID=1324217 RepID=A0ABZ0IQC4_9BACT|nr:heavy metal-associated domain-containing protein [Imperialibacter roseus]WOK07243.1 heavy metal-associated domain-containing protein [Imperialibacter roseus]